MSLFSQLKKKVQFTENLTHSDVAFSATVATPVVANPATKQPQIGKEHHGLEIA